MEKVKKNLTFDHPGPPKAPEPPKYQKYEICNFKNLILQKNSNYNGEYIPKKFLT